MSENKVNSVYVQYGCGWCAPKNWINFDASPTLRFERIPILGKVYTKNANRFPENVKYGDIVHGLPISKNSCAGVYCSHVLEHLSLFDFRKALKNTYCMLMPGGMFRLVLPDLEHEIKMYIADTSKSRAINFMEATSLGKSHRPKNIKEMIFEYLGNSQHLWMWDFSSIEQELNEAGFVEIRRAYFGDSSDINFNSVENLDRWSDALGVECNKP